MTNIKSDPDNYRIHNNKRLIRKNLKVNISDQMYHLHRLEVIFTSHKFSLYGRNSEKNTNFIAPSWMDRYILFFQ